MRILAKTKKEKKREFRGRSKGEIKYMKLLPSSLLSS